MMIAGLSNPSLLDGIKGARGPQLVPIVTLA
jgi:hypothetical protein